MGRPILTSEAREGQLQNTAATRAHAKRMRAEHNWCCEHASKADVCEECKPSKTQVRESWESCRARAFAALRNRAMGTATGADAPPVSSTAQGILDSRLSDRMYSRQMVERAQPSRFHAADSSATVDASFSELVERSLADIRATGRRRTNASAATQATASSSAAAAAPVSATTTSGRRPRRPPSLYRNPPQTDDARIQRLLDAHLQPRSTRAAPSGLRDIPIEDPTSAAAASTTRFRSETPSDEVAILRTTGGGDAAPPRYLRFNDLASGVASTSPRNDEATERQTSIQNFIDQYAAQFEEDEQRLDEVARSTRANGQSLAAATASAAAAAPALPSFQILERGVNQYWSTSAATPPPPLSATSDSRLDPTISLHAAGMYPNLSTRREAATREQEERGPAARAGATWISYAETLPSARRELSPPFRVGDDLPRGWRYTSNIPSPNPASVVGQTPEVTVEIMPRLIADPPLARSSTATTTTTTGTRQDHAQRRAVVVGDGSAPPSSSMEQQWERTVEEATRQDTSSFESILDGLDGLSYRESRAVLRVLADRVRRTLLDREDGSGRAAAASAAAALAAAAAGGRSSASPPALAQRMGGEEGGAERRRGGEGETVVRSGWVVTPETGEAAAAATAALPSPQGRARRFTDRAAIIRDLLQDSSSWRRARLQPSGVGAGADPGESGDSLSGGASNDAELLFRSSQQTGVLAHRRGGGSGANDNDAVGTPSLAAETRAQSLPPCPVTQHDGAVEAEMEVDAPSTQNGSTSSAASSSSRTGDASSALASTWSSAAPTPSSGGHEGRERVDDERRRRVDGRAAAAEPAQEEDDESEAEEECRFVDDDEETVPTSAVLVERMHRRTPLPPPPAPLQR
ncbi:hypothetical protein V8E36_002973 [Tilletia maclaganii]